MPPQNSIIGLTVDEAKKIIGTIRVVNKDGQGFCVTLDYMPSRCNVYIVNNIITKIASFG
jgi:hypothetical protein